MKNILIGNGLNIQFSGHDYSNRSIIERAITKIKTDDFPCDLYPKEIGQWLVLLFSEGMNIADGKYDIFASASFEKRALKNFKNRYSKRKIKKIYDIGFEDYFLIHDLFCCKNNITNPQRYEFRECLKRLFIDSIYNNGQILQLYKNFPTKLINFIKSYENIFTTNYDNNLENVLGRKVHYLHGAFHILDEVYDENSFRNMLSDRPVDKVGFNKKFTYLYSNALTTYTGEMKEYSMDEHSKANSAVSKFTEAYQNKPELRQQIESWKDCDSEIVRRLFESISLKSKNTNLGFKETYPVEQFKDIQGGLTIFGLSPYNDNHIFELIKNNTHLAGIEYFYYDKKETLIVKDYLDGKNVDIKDVKLFWDKIK